MIIFAKAAMVLSWTYYTVLLSFLWGGALLGETDLIWESFGFPVQPTAPPMWTLIVASLISLAAMCSLGLSYLGAWRILNGGALQDFRQLARNLRQVAWGLIGFWVGYNLFSGVVQYLIVIGLPSTEGFDFGWDPLDLDIIFAIIGIVLLAISQTMERAWLAEEETRHFL